MQFYVVDGLGDRTGCFGIGNWGNRVFILFMIGRRDATATGRGNTKNIDPRKRERKGKRKELQSEKPVTLRETISFHLKKPQLAVFTFSISSPSPLSPSNLSKNKSFTAGLPSQPRHIKPIGPHQGPTLKFPKRLVFLYVSEQDVLPVFKLLVAEDKVNDDKGQNTLTVKRPHSEWLQRRRAWGGQTRDMEDDVEWRQLSSLLVG
jgi:hypothetical protein